MIAESWWYPVAHTIRDELGLTLRSQCSVTQYRTVFVLDNGSVGHVAREPQTFPHCWGQAPNPVNGMAKDRWPSFADDHDLSLHEIDLFTLSHNAQLTYFNRLDLGVHCNDASVA